MGTGPKGRTQGALTEERKRVFIDTLANTGSAAAAAHAATPWATARHGGLQTFRDERKRDPAFAEAWARAEEAALAKVESEVMRRAMEPSERPIVSGGKLLGVERTYDNKLLLSLARRLNPEAWSEKKQIEHSGQVQHDHRHAHAIAVLEPRDVLLLAPDDQQQLIALVEKIALAKEASHAQPARLLEASPA